LSKFSKHCFCKYDKLINPINNPYQCTLLSLSSFAGFSFRVLIILHLIVENVFFFFLHELKFCDNLYNPVNSFCQVAHNKAVFSWLACWNWDRGDFEKIRSIITSKKQKSFTFRYGVIHFFGVASLTHFDSFSSLEIQLFIRVSVSDFKLCISQSRFLIL